MNTQVGKSIGIALLLAAGLLAALFAMGVFAPAGVDAGVKGTPSHTLNTTSGSESITVLFEVDDTVDGMVNGEEILDDVIISVPGSLLNNADTPAAVTTQDGASVGSTTVSGDATAGLTIRITKAATGGNNLVANKEAKVVIMASNLSFATGVEAKSGVLIIEQRPSTKKFNTNLNDAEIFELAAAKLVGNNLVVEFNARRGYTVGYSVVITAPRAYFSGNPGTTTAPAGVTDNDDSDATAAATATTPATWETPTAADTNPTATADGYVTVTNYEKGEKITVTISGLTLTNQAISGGVQKVTIAEGSHHEVELTVGDDPVAGPDAAAPTAVTTDPVTTAVLSSNLADAATSVTLTGTAGIAIAGGTDIAVTLSGFQIPDSIDEDEVIINGNLTADTDTDTAGDQPEDDDYYGPPASVAVNGSKITLSLPFRMPNTSGGTTLTTIGATGGTTPSLDDGKYSITFKQSAGLKNPNSAGTKTITVQDRDAAVDGKHPETKVEIVSHIAVDSSWVRRGQAVTVTAKGVNAAGDATAHLYSGNVMPGDEDFDNLELVESPRSLVLGRGPRDEGTVTVEGISTSRSEFIADAKDATSDPDANARGVNLIVMVDAAGVVIGHTYLGILPSVALDVTDVRRTGEVVVKVSDWYYGDRIDRVRINGILVDLPDNTYKPNDTGDEPDPWVHPVDGDNYEFSVDAKNKAEFTVVVDRDTRLGEMQVDLRGKDSLLKQGSAGSPDIHKQTVQVGFFPLTLSPSTAVTEQVIQIEGEEFLARACITSITVGERTIDEATNGDTVSSDFRDCVDTDSNGKLTATFKVPRGLNPGTYSVVVRDNGNRVGEAKLEVPKPEITLDPMTSQRGTTVTVVGENFPADDVVTIDYRGVTVEAAQSDTIGQFRATFQVPITAPIGASHEVLAASENKADGKLDPPQNQPEVVLTAKEEHRVSDETLDFDREKVAPGEHLGIIAGNLPLFTPVSIVIGDRAVAGKVLGEDNASDGFGNYVDSVLVPQLPPGITIVELTVHTERGDDVRVAEFVEITDIVTRPTNEVFADLIAAGQLQVVWRYDNATQTWASYDPSAPAELNDLNLVSTDDIVWVETTASVQFQGSTLSAGWNLISLE